MIFDRYKHENAINLNACRSAKDGEIIVFGHMILSLKLKMEKWR